MRFIRHVDRKRYLRGGSVLEDVFRCRIDRGETGLSLTLQAEQLSTHDALDAYQRASRLPTGDLPGLVNDFIHKVGVAAKEVRESVCWLQFIQRSGWTSADLRGAIREAGELAAILGASARTARARVGQAARR